MRSHNLIIEFESRTAALPRFQITTDKHITVDVIISHLSSSTAPLILNHNGDFLSVSNDGVHLHYARELFRSSPICINTFLDVLCSHRSVTLIGVTPTHRIELKESSYSTVRLTITEPPPIKPMS